MGKAAHRMLENHLGLVHLSASVTSLVLFHCSLDIVVDGSAFVGDSCHNYFIDHLDIIINFDLLSFLHVQYFGSLHDHHLDCSSGASSSVVSSDFASSVPLHPYLAFQPCREQTVLFLPERMLRGVFQDLTSCKLIWRDLRLPWVPFAACFAYESLVKVDFKASAGSFHHLLMPVGLHRMPTNSSNCFD